jgi:hypothetical protein
VPKKTNKLMASRKLKGLRRVYVSWVESDAEKRKWKDSFFQRVLAETGVLEHTFLLPKQTGDQEPGKLVKDALRPEDPITDVVGVITDQYVFANMRKNVALPAAELAAFIKMARSEQAKDKIRVWLAPVDQATWKNYVCSEVALADPQGEHRDWLVRLKESTRFTWPVENAGTSAREIAEAVSTIIDEELKG